MTNGPPNILSLAWILSLVYVFVAAVFVVRRLTDKSGKELARRIEAATRAREAADVPGDLVKRHEMSGLRWLDVFLSRQAWSRRMDKMLDQADIEAPLGVFVLLSLVLAVTGSMAASIYTQNLLARLAVGVGLGFLPFKWIAMRKAKRMTEFERQLPEALDLVGRALRAGHTFTSGMGMVVSEFAEPISSEFRTTLEEINFGMGVTVALDNLMDRVDCPDLNFFVISVKIQNETGGNLAEIIGNIASLIRERLKLKGRIRVLSAEGRMAAWVLCLLPFFVCGAVQVLNPGYLGLLFTEPLGRILIYVVMGLMTLGVLVIRKMVRIEV
ncbi:Type II secretion system F domain protein [Solidesulfovibrio fructosivorans JJ]]|uniref:Type II secretion system F domain protein n=1 Tax=Solidesulfovibrio fructosivorans JJ] TaxID=596151 RepID=E1JZJ7_SOLFR|nr:type II secretion system F family protein [Solidesulfovibrio fructosivorans]EFL50244.1 Type II secretion system F domain protein [Solidesulfovibrio fructosivorans JJ]]